MYVEPTKFPSRKTLSFFVILSRRDYSFVFEFMATNIFAVAALNLEILKKLKGLFPKAFDVFLKLTE